ncbi:MAG: Fe-Mn family superoxide dismutase [Buchnera aphidicola (Eriosoma harunire)]
MSYSLPELKYEYDALEPYFDSLTMSIHHSKHHQTYINNANNILQAMNFPNVRADILITRLMDIPEDSRETLRNNIGGHVNHSLFWNGLKIGTKLTGLLKDALEQKFGDFLQFKRKFESVALSRFGSGWVWLLYHNNNLSIVSTANQDNPLMGDEVVGLSGYPILCLDVWEHSYYLKYKNNRLEYVKSFWNVVNWDEAENRYIKIINRS